MDEPLKENVSFFEIQNKWSNWFAIKICHTKDLTSQS
jgi:hypothetical protein